MSVHSVKRSQCHLAWDNSIEPVRHISSGSIVRFSCLDASNGQITAASTSAALSDLVFSQLDQVNGPIYVESARPGDTLQIDVLDIQTADWGWTALIPGFGLLNADEEWKGRPELRIWKLDRENKVGYLEVEVEDCSENGNGLKKKKTIAIPLRPFAGEMGVARGEKGAFSTIPPYRTGGNLDTKYLVKGATLFLPVEVEGALFSIGDGHAAQGDGEVCGTAIETPIEITIRLTVRKDRRSYTNSPHFHTSTHQEKGSITIPDDAPRYCTTGVGPDLKEAAKSATRSMINYLEAEYGIDRVSGYILCSVIGDLRIHEIVDEPNFVVGMVIPLTVFDTLQKA
ncbi:hypothetical protein AX16_009818 [Volvariella volvacea WC 439]|nr:hypothetical protein AX16_009818 [Volvariella volvacea WC 439]